MFCTDLTTNSDLCFIWHWPIRFVLLLCRAFTMWYERSPYTKQIHLIFKGKVKGKVRPCTGISAHRRSRGIALPSHDHGTRRGEGSSRPGCSLPLGKTQYPLYRRLGGPQGQSGQVRKISTPPGFDPRTVQPIASRDTDWATRPISLLEG